jgi:Glycosyl hydrolases family 31/Domain of unknown function (DUF5110)
MIGRTGRALAAVAITTAAAPTPAASAAQPKPPPVIVDGGARFQVLSPTLIRIEYASDGAFEDRPTLTAVDRTARRGRVRTRVVHGIRVIKTSRMVLRYRIGSGPFGTSNLKLTLGRGEARRSVQPSFGPPPSTTSAGVPPTTTQPNPGDPAPRTSGNLGGWYRGLDGQEGPVPLHDGILSRDGWYLLDDSVSPILTEGGRWYAPRPGHAGAYQDGYLFAYGRDYARGLRDFRNLTGPAPLLPRRAFGNWFSQYTFFSAAAYRELVAQFRANRVPLDVLVVDTDFKSPNPWNGWQWSPVFGDPVGFFDWAHAQGLNVALNVHPSISHEDPAYPAAGAAAGGLATDSGRCRIHLHDDGATCSVWNWARREQVDSYFSLHAPFESQGADFWWLDWNNDESDARAPGLTPDTWINALYAERQAARGSRWAVLSRVGSSFWNYHAGMPGAWAEHRYSIHFTGDAYARWPMLAFQIRFTTAEGAGIGLPYVSHDIGSFQGGQLPSDLYVRWVQFGAFQPILRLHSDHGRRLPWEYPQRANRIAAGFLRLRESLIPYLYTAARQAYDAGLPMARPMYLGWPGADAAYRFDSQYMLGDELLVAPVAKPGLQPRKTVWLPPGEWVDIFTGQAYAGGHTKTFSVPLDRIPVFARAGSIVPRQPEASRGVSGQIDPLALDVYAGADGGFDLYEDANDGLAYRQGEFARTDLRWSDAATALTIAAARGAYPGMKSARRYVVRFVGVERPRRVLLTAGGGTRALGGWSYDPARDELEVVTDAISARGGGTVRLDFTRP